MKRLIGCTLCLMMCAVFSLSAQQKAVVEQASGKAEVKLPGKEWTAAQQNMVLPQGAMISTGFDSRMVISLGLTKLSVNPLTRIELSQLVKQGNTNSTSLVLKVGKVNAQVKSTQGERTEFTLKGPASTAAVRGTGFDYDGWSIQVTEGVVEFFNLLYQKQNVAAGQGSQTDGNGIPLSGDESARGDNDVRGASSGGLLGTGSNSLSGKPAITGTFSVQVWVN